MIGLNSPKGKENRVLTWSTNDARMTNEIILIWLISLLTRKQGECVPNFPELRELGDLSDGVCLVGLLAFYAPDVVDWTRMATNEPFSMADCLYNLELVHKFCSESLATNIFHLGLEDIVYMHR